jgi:hypothetical protein
MNAGSVVGGSLFPWLAGAVAEGVGVWTLLPFALALSLLQHVIWWPMARRVVPRSTVRRIRPVSPSPRPR